MKTMDISEIVTGFDVKVGQNCQVNNLMISCEYQRSRSFCALAQIFFLGQLNANFICLVCRTMK